MVNQVSHCKIPGEACAEGRRICSHVNRVEFANQPPIELAFEKVFQNFTLPDKKQYVANKWVYEAKDAVIDLKGMQHKRKSPPPFVKSVLSKACDLLIQEGDLEAAMQHVKKSLMQLVSHRVPITQLFERCMLSKNPEDYGGEVEEVKPKTPKELERIKQLEKQSRLHQFFVPESKIERVERKRKQEDGQEFMEMEERLVSPEEVERRLCEKEEEELSQTRLKKRSITIPAAVQVALRLNEQCPDNPRTAGSVVHLLVVESDNKADKTKGERALEPMEVRSEA
jgi:DNA polymerase elongation subunit (family B)